MVRPTLAIAVLALASWLVPPATARVAPAEADSDPIYIGIWIEDIAIEFSYGGDDDGGDTEPACLTNGWCS